MNGSKAGKCAEATVGSGYHTLAADISGVTDNPLRDQFGMFDKVTARVKNSGNKDFVRRQLMPFPHFPFMLMAWIGALNQKSRGPGFEKQRQNRYQRDVIVMRTLVIAP